MGGPAAPDHDSLAARLDMDSLERPLEKPQVGTRPEVVPHDGTPSADTP